MREMKQKVVIVLDCGATNLRAVAVNSKGEVLVQKTYPNHTTPDPFYASGLIWDADEIWGKLTKATQEVVSRIKKEDIAGITVTSFGVDGAPMMKSGELLYPVISWACRRTEPVMNHIGKYMSLERLYEISGVNAFSFNTINKMIWFREKRPEVLEQMDHFVFMPSIFLQRLTGEFVTDTTMAGTSMMTDLSTRDFSDEILQAIGTEHKFPPLVEPGTVVGKVQRKASEVTGIPEGVPVVATGHDTQFAVFGSGAKQNEVVLSSGTWEILMARISHCKTTQHLLQQGVTVELDAVPGLLNPGIQWLGSGILEWIKRTFYSLESDQANVYDVMMQEAEGVSPGTVHLGIDFLNEHGILSGLGINTKRDEIYRAALESLARKTKQSLGMLEEAGKFNAESVIVVGGGSQNRLWNQLRQQELSIPVTVVDQQETTVLGAAKMASIGLSL